MKKLMKDRFFILVMLQGLVFLILFFCCFQKDRLQMELAEDGVVISKMQEDSLVYVSAPFVLRRGVYHVTVQDRAGKSNTVFSLEADKGTYRGILSNSVTVMPNGEVSYDVWVLQKTSVYARCLSVEEGDLPSVHVWVSWTHLGFVKDLWIVLTVFGVIDGAVLLRRRILSGAVSPKRQAVFWTIMACVFLSYFPLFANYCYIGTEGLREIARIDGLAQAFRSGSWLAKDLSYAFPALLLCAGFPYYLANNAFVFLLLFATAWISYYSFYDCLHQEYPALLGCVCYLLNPYFLSAIYVRGNYMAAMGTMFLPLLFAGFYQLFTKSSEDQNYGRYKWYLVVGLSALSRCNVMLAVMATLTMLLCGIFQKAWKKHILLELGKGAALLFALNAWTVALLVYDKAGYVHRYASKESGFDIADFAQFILNHDSEKMARHVFQQTPLSAGFFILLIGYSLWRKQRKGKTGDKNAIAFGLMAVVSLLFTASYFPWHHLPGVFNGWSQLAVLFEASFAVYSLADIWGENAEHAKALWAAGMVSAAFLALYLVNQNAIESVPVLLYDAKNIGSVLSEYADADMTCRGNMLICYGARAVSLATACAAIVLWCHRRKEKRHERGQKK